MLIVLADSEIPVAPLSEVAPTVEIRSRGQEAVGSLSQDRLDPEVGSLI